MGASEYPRVGEEPGYSGTPSDGRADSTSMDALASGVITHAPADEPRKRHDTPIPRPKMQVVERAESGIKLPEIPVNETLVLGAAILIVLMFCAMAIGMVVSYRVSHRADGSAMTQPQTPESHEDLPVRRSLH